MAIITPGPLISTIRGSIGGTTFSSIRAGLIAKRKIPGKKQLTQKQQLSRQADAQIIALWNSLTFGEKMAWKDYADLNTKTNRYGQVRNLTGFNWFVSVTNSLLYMGLEFSPDTPAGTVPDFLPSFILTLGSSSMVITWAEPIDSDLVDLYIYSTPPIKTTSNFNNGKYRMHARFTGDYETEFDIISQWEAVHGLTWSDLFNPEQMTVNVQIFAVNKANGITGQSVTSIGVFGLGIGSMVIGSTFEVG